MDVTIKTAVSAVRYNFNSPESEHYEVTMTSPLLTELFNGPALASSSSTATAAVQQKARPTRSEDIEKMVPKAEVCVKELLKFSQELRQQL